MEELKGKKLLILAGAGVHSKVVRRAKEMGVYTIVTDYLEDSPAKLIADESWMYSITDVDKIVDKCKKEKVDGVLNFCIDPAQKPYQQICEKLNLPCFASKEQFEIMTDKHKFKEFCKKNEIDVIPEYSLEQIRDGNAVYPLFIKPSDSRGSRGQSVCYSKENVSACIEFAKENSKDESVVCEKYMVGNQDIGSAFFVVDGEPYLVKLGDRFLGKEEDNLQKQVICTRLPASFAPDFEKNVMPRVKKFIKALGIKFGPVFMQGFVDDNTVRYYDPALRMPGGDYDVILRNVTGFDTVGSMIHFALTGDTKSCFGNPSDCYKLKNGTALLMTVSVRGGRIDKIEGFDEVLKKPETVYGRQIIDAGAEISDNGDISQRVAAFGMYVEEGKSCEAVINSFYDTYKVLDSDGENMVISRLDVKNIKKY